MSLFKKKDPRHHINIRDKSPFDEAAKKVQPIKDERIKLESVIAKYEEKVAESEDILKNADSNLEYYKNILDAIPLKGEFEKEKDYKKRRKLAKVDYDNIKNSIDKHKQSSFIGGIQLSAKKLELDELNAEIIKYEELSIPINSGLQITEIGTYDAEKEFFSIVLQGISYKIYVAINNASDFKQNYNKLILYKYETTYWLEYEQKWYKIIDGEVS
jgi:hypothetical protein